MSQLLEIKPKIGLGKLSFGATQKEAEAYLGKAEEIEELDEGDGNNVCIWHYWKQGYSLFFNSEHDHVFTCAEIDNTEATLWGEKVFGFSENQLIDLFNKNGVMSVETEDQEWGERRVSFNDLLVDCYFENNKLTSINYGIFIDENRVLILPN